MRRKVPAEGNGKTRARRRVRSSGEAAPPGSFTVSSLMTRDVPCVGEEMSVDSLAGFLLDRELIGVPVVDETGMLTGFVSIFDLEREHFDRGDTEERVPLKAKSRGYAYELGPGFHADPIAHATVREVMNVSPPSVLDEAPAATALSIMAAEHLEALPVVNGAGAPVGVVFAVDLVRWAAEQNGVIVPPPRPARWRQKAL